MKNVINAEHRFRRAGVASQSLSDGLFALLHSISQVPQGDRPLMAERLGLLAARLSPHDPLDGARRLFLRADWEGDKWQKRKRLIRLPGESRSPAEAYGSYEATGANWARIAKAAAELLAPHASGITLEKEKERVVRNILLGTSLLPQQFPSPKASSVTGLVAERSQAIAHRLQKETPILDFWDTLRGSPFALEYEYASQIEGSLEPDAAALVGQIRRTDVAWRGQFSADLSRHGIGALSWSFPFIRLGVLRRRLVGNILIPPPHLNDALWNPEDDVPTHKQPGPKQRRLLKWFSSLGSDGDYNPKTRSGWVQVPIETTRSVYLEACPRADGEIGLWLKINEPFIDNFIPVVASSDLVALAYEREEMLEGYEPFQFDEDWAFDMSHRSSGILRWPEWCREIVTDDKLWNGGVIGVRDTDSLIHRDHAGDEREPRFTANAPDWFGIGSPYSVPEDDPGYIPDGVGGWLDDPSNQEVEAQVVSNSQDCSFLPMIAQDTSIDVPCKKGTIADAFLRNLACDQNRIDQLLTEQAQLIVKSGMEYHERRMEKLRSLMCRTDD